MSLILEIFYLITVVFTIVLVIQQRGNPLKTISWLLVVLLLPILGIIIYFFFGQNYRKQKIFSRKGLRDLERISELNVHKIKHIDTNESLIDTKIRTKRHIMKLLLNNSKSILTDRNKIDIYNSGEKAFNEIISELENASHHIHLEYYIIEEDKLGNNIKDILIRKAKEGVEVRVIYDYLGSWDLSDHYIDSIIAAGAEVYSFLPVHFPKFTNKINNRNHRKIIVVDGKVGFVGGMNIAIRYIEGNESMGSWRDTHLKIEGDAVSSLQQIFLIDWSFVSNKIIKSKKYFPPHSIENTCLVQITASGPDSDWASIMQAYFSAITTAQDHIYISMPYFIPNESMLTALKTAALSGVEVRIMIPYHSDSHIVFRSTLSFVSELLEAGIHVHFFKNGFNHSKLVMVDGILASVGSANMDIRSFDQNFEVNALIYNEKIAISLEKSFKNDLKHCIEYSLKAWEKRHWSNQAKESFARILSPLF